MTFIIYNEENLVKHWEYFYYLKEVYLKTLRGRSSSPTSIQFIWQSPMTTLGWPHTAWLSVIEVGQAAVHDVRLASFLWLWFQCVCPLMASHNTYYLTCFFLTLDVWYLFTAAPAKCSCCSLPWTSRPSWPCTWSSFQDGWVMMQRADRMWSTGEGNGKPLQYSCLENPMNSMKRQNDRILKEELPRSVGTQYATGDQWRNNSRKNEGMKPKQKQYPAVDVTGDRSKVWCCKEQYCIGTCQVHESRQIGGGQTRDGKSERWHSRNQQTKMDWNGWI